MTVTDQLTYAQWLAEKIMAQRALRSVKDLHDEQQLAIALRHAGYGREDIDAYLKGALEIERALRVTQKQIGDPFSAEVML
jgi:hypothetical protein